MEKMTLAKVSKKYGIPAKRGAVVTLDINGKTGRKLTLKSCTKVGVLNFRDKYGKLVQLVPMCRLINWGS